MNLNFPLKSIKIIPKAQIPTKTIFLNHKRKFKTPQQRVHSCEYKNEHLSDIEMKIILFTTIKPLMTREWNCKTHFNFLRWCFHCRERETTSACLWMEWSTRNKKFANNFCKAAAEIFSPPRKCAKRWGKIFIYLLIRCLFILKVINVRHRVTCCGCCEGKILSP